MENHYKNKIVWIIGASSGIGEALVYNLANAGARLIISSRRESELERVKNSTSTPENIKILPLDLLDPTPFKEKTTEAFAFFNTINYVFFNGGTSSRGFVAETNFEVHERLMNLNYFSYAKLTKEILPYFSQQHQGHFIVTSSVMGKIGTPKRSAYAASKHALHGFFDCLRAEVASQNIKVTLLVPGHVSTNISLHSLMPDGSERGEKTSEHENGITPEQAAIKIVKAVKNNKNEVFIGKKNQEYWALFASKFSPNLLAKILEKKVPK